MPLFESLNHVFKHPWHDISQASWRKYPNPARPDVLSVDMLDRAIDPDTGVLTTKRLICMKGSGPTWLQNLMGTSLLYFVEEATVDPRTQTMVLSSKNVSFSNLLVMEETCTYTPYAENKEYTSFVQDAKVTAFPFGIKNKIETLVLDGFVKNANKGREIMEQAISRLKQEQRRVEELAEEGLANLERSLPSSSINIAM